MEQFVILQHNIANSCKRYIKMNNLPCRSVRESAQCSILNAFSMYNSKHHVTNL